MILRIEIGDKLIEICFQSLDPFGQYILHQSAMDTMETK